VSQVFRKKVELTNLVSEVIILHLLSQVKIFEEDFRKERSDRERMNEEKEDLRRQVERLQGQMTNLTNQVRSCFLLCPKWHPIPYVVHNATGPGQK
jgi:SMC interacting uncharacterized protein involved in chromosome segregation